MTHTTRILVLTCAACFTWLVLAPTSSATLTARQQRPLQRPGTPPNPTHFLDGARHDPRSTVRECEAPCLGCAVSVLGVGTATAGIALGCGGAIFSGGLTLGACWLAIVGAPAVALVAATNCNSCDVCLNHPDPETPPGGDGGSDECDPCDPSEPLADCLDPQIDWCEDEGEPPGNP